MINRKSRFVSALGMFILLFAVADIVAIIDTLSRGGLVGGLELLILAGIIALGFGCLFRSRKIGGIVLGIGLWASVIYILCLSWGTTDGLSFLIDGIICAIGAILIFGKRIKKLFPIRR